MNKLDDILRRHTVQHDQKDTRNKLLGAAFVVTDRHGTLYTGASGRLGLDTETAPFTDRSFTWVASLTKLATTISVMQLVEKRQLDLDADLRPLVLELREASILRCLDDHGRPVYEENTSPITMRQLLTHTSGFSYEFSDPLLLRWSRTAPNRNLKRIQWSRTEITTPLRFAPARSWAYGVGLDWAGQILEALTGQTLGQYMRENVFRPSGMTDSGFWPHELPQTDASMPENVERTADMTLVRAPLPTPQRHDIESGGAGLFTTAADYASLLRTFLRRGLVSDDTMAHMFSPQLDDAQANSLNQIAFHPLVRATMAAEFPTGQRLNHGLGGLMNLDDVPGKRRARSLAWNGILNSRWWADIKTGVAAVLIVNVRPNGDPVVARLYDELELAVYGDLLGHVNRSRM